MGNPGTWVVVALCAWGIYKCSVIAQRPMTNKKSAYALAASLLVWLVLVLVASRRDGESGAQLLFLALVIAAVSIGAIVTAVLGLFEIRQSKLAPLEGRGAAYTQGTRQAIAAILLAAALIGPLAYYGISHYLKRPG